MSISSSIRPIKFDEVVFVAGMAWRILYGGIRIVLGYVLLNYIGDPLVDTLNHITRHEFLNGSHDVLFRFAEHFLAHHPFSVTYFLAIYFLFWGTVDIVLSLAMLRHQFWAFPISLFVMTTFIVYEIYRYTHTHSLTLLIFIIIDTGIIYLIRHEYRELRAGKREKLEC